MKGSFPQSNQECSARVSLFQHARRLALSTPAKLTLAATTLVVVMFSLTSVSLPTRAADQNRRNQNWTLAGNWMATLTRVNPASGQVSSFLTLVTYFEDGNLLHESNSPDFNGTGRGSWKRTGPREFTLAFTFFRYDSARAYAGTRRITSTITLSRDGNEYEAESVGQDFDPSGNPQSTFQATGIGRRL